MLFRSTRGNRAKAARLLDTTERILNYKIRGLSIDVRRFKPSDGTRRTQARAGDVDTQPLDDDDDEESTTSATP